MSELEYETNSMPEHTEEKAKNVKSKAETERG